MLSSTQAWFLEYAWDEFLLEWDYNKKALSEAEISLMIQTYLYKFLRENQTIKNITINIADFTILLFNRYVNSFYNVYIRPELNY